MSFLSKLIVGYYHIGSLLMLIHDASDIPLDLLKVGMSLDWDILTVSTLHHHWLVVYMNM